MELTIEEALQRGMEAHKNGKLEDAERFYRAILKSQPNHPDANHNIGVMAITLNKPDLALPFLKNALDFNPKIEQFWLSYIKALIQKNEIEIAKQTIEKAQNQGINQAKLNILIKELTPERKNKSGPSEQQINILVSHYQSGRNDEAEKTARYFIKEFPKHEIGWKILAAILGQTERKPEAIEMYRKLLELSPEDAHSHFNIGNELKALSRLEEAISSYQTSVRIMPNFAEAHNNLGNIYKSLNKLDDAEISYSQAILHKPEYALAYFNLSQLQYIKGDKTLSLNSIKQAIKYDPNKENKLLMNYYASSVNSKPSARQSGKKLKSGISCHPFTTNRLVEPELITTLFEMDSREMDNADNTPVFGNGTCSLNYDLFHENRTDIKVLENDLTDIMKKAVKSDVYIYDSFFNIYGAGAGIPSHTHLNKLDEDKLLGLGDQKFSLVYYLSVGDQSCSEPGVLKFYEPDEELLPEEGMVVIFPAGRKHSAVYGGEKKRVIVGINFYAL